MDAHEKFVELSIMAEEAVFALCVAALLAMSYFDYRKRSGRAG